MKPNRLWLIVPWAVFLVLAVGWTVYWNIAAGAAEQRVAEIVAQRNARGDEAAIGRITRHGFPALLRLRLHEARYASGEGGWRAETETADLHLNLMNPQHVTAEAKAPIVVTRGDGSVTNISADTLIASVRMENGRLATAGVEADNLALDDPAQEGVLRAQKLMMNMRPDARAAGEYQMSFEARALTLPREVRSFEGFGVEVASLRAAIVVEQAAALARANAGDPLGPWREANGRLRFEALELQWGPLQATATGEGGLDAQRRLMGALTVPIEQPAPVLIAIANSPRTDSNARQALALLAVAYTQNNNTLTLDVDARDGVLRLEGIAARTLPAVY